MFIKVYFKCLAAVKFRCPQWSKDEKICARNVNNEIIFYEDNNFGEFLWTHIVDCYTLLVS